MRGIVLSLWLSFSSWIPENALASIIHQQRLIRSEALEDVKPRESRKRPGLSRGRFWAIAIMTGAAVVMVLVAVKIDRMSYQAYIQDLRLQTTIAMVEVRENIEEGVFDHILLLQRLASHLSSHPDLDEDDYLNFARNLTAGHDEVVNLAAAPDLIVRLVYPYEPNKDAIGLDYRKRPDQLPEVMRAIESGSVTITGPVDPVQGGRGLILRQPVYVTDGAAPKPANCGASSLW